MLAAIVALWVQPAAAVTMYATLTGTLTHETATGYPVPFGTGSQITLTASFDSANVVNWGDTGYQLVGLRNPGDTFDLALGGFHWDAITEQSDGLPFYEFITEAEAHYASLPAIAFKDGKVAGVMGYLIPAQSPTPVLWLGSYTGGGFTHCYPGPCESQFSPLQLSSAFMLEKGYSRYANSYDGPAFNGIWNFASSSVGVPEPASWAMMILGVGIAGAGLRQRRAVPPIRGRLLRLSKCAG